MADTHDPIRRCSRRRCSGQLARSGAQRFACLQKAGVGAQIHRSHTLCYISGCHRCRKGSAGSMYSKVSFIVMKRRRLPTPMWQSMPARPCSLKPIRYFGGTSRYCHLLADSSINRAVLVTLSPDLRRKIAISLCRMCCPCLAWRAKAVSPSIQ